MSPVNLSPKSELYCNEISRWINESDFSPFEKEQRKRDLEDFRKKGLPTRKNEDYRYTNLEKALPDTFNPASSSQKDFISREELPQIPTEYALVFYHGQYCPHLSKLPPGLCLEREDLKKSKEPHRDLPHSQDPLEALNHSAAPFKYSLCLQEKINLPPLSLIHLLDPQENQMALSHLTIEAQKESKATFLEIFYKKEKEKEKDPSTFSNSHTLIHLSAHSHLTYIKAVLTGKEHTHMGKFEANLERNSNLKSLTFSVDGKLNRHNIEVNIKGEGAHADINGLYTGRHTKKEAYGNKREENNQHQDCFSLINHYAPHTTAQQIFKGILDDESRGAFTGKVIIHRNAQKVESNQLNKNLLLSPKAHINTRPQIEVYADDVKCGHGATVGQINDEEIFYLQGRGIPKERAQKILCHAFAYEVIEKYENENRDISSWLGKILFDIFEKYALENLQSSSSPMPNKDHP